MRRHPVTADEIVRNVQDSSSLKQTNWLVFIILNDLLKFSTS
jgi:hypothetical protein